MMSTGQTLQSEIYSVFIVHHFIIQSLVAASADCNCHLGVLEEWMLFVLFVILCPCYTSSY